MGILQQVRCSAAVATEGGSKSEKRLAPMHLDMLMFKLTDPNMDVTYTLWRFDVQGWLDQYQEESMIPTSILVYGDTQAGGYTHWRMAQTSP